MRLATILAFVILAPGFARAQDAKAVAQEVLNKGAALFDTRDAAAMAATFTEDAEATVLKKDRSTGVYKLDVTRGRAEIEHGYQELFKGREAGTTSRNDVEYARLVASDVLIIQGTFTLDVNQDGSIPFIQVRVKRGEKWLIASLKLFGIDG